MVILVVCYPVNIVTRDPCCQSQSPLPERSTFIKIHFPGQISAPVIRYNGQEVFSGDLTRTGFTSASTVPAKDSKPNRITVAFRVIWPRIELDRRIV